MEKNSQEIEEWRSIEGYEGLYQVSSLGRVMSCDRFVSNGKSIRLVKSRVLKPGSTKGYLQVNLSKNNKVSRIPIHRMVAKAFPEICGQFRNGLEVDHLNTLKTDNRAVNLRWCTSKENQNNPLTKQHKKENALKGEKHPMYGKLGKYNPNSIPILQFDRQGNFIAEWDSAASAERQLGIWNENISACCKGKQKTAKGFIFRYKTA